MKKIFIPLSSGGAAGLKYVGDISLGKRTVSFFAVAGTQPAKAYLDALGLEPRLLIISDEERETLVACDEPRVISYDGTKLLRASGAVVSLEENLSGDGSNSERSDILVVPLSLLESPLEQLS